jgi:hypothetical protein
MRHVFLGRERGQPLSWFALEGGTVASLTRSTGRRSSSSGGEIQAPRRGRLPPLQGDAGMALIGDMLAFVNDKLVPHGFDEIVQDDFAALRQMLERRR